MAVTVTQTASYQSGSSTFTTASISGASGAVVGDTIVYAIISDVPVSSVTQGTIFLQTGSNNPFLALVRQTATTTAIPTTTVNFASPAHIAIYMVETNAKSVTTPVIATGLNVISATGSTPITYGLATGDLPYGFFGASQAQTVTPQSGWTEVANLNSTAGTNCQLEVQKGPLTTSNAQTVTASATFAGSTGSVFSGALVIFSSSLPQTLVTQDVVEVIGIDTARAHITQEVVQAIAVDTARLHSTQEVIQVLADDSALARGTQLVVQALCPLYTRVTQNVVEAVALGTPNVRVTQYVVQLLFSTAGQRRRQPDDEFLLL